MTIKERITIGFGLLVATMLLLFSLFIYQTYESSRRADMRTRLQRRALSTQAYFSNKEEFLRSNYLTLPEQHRKMYNAANQLVYSSSGPNDYTPTTALLTRARKNEVYFTYTNPHWEQPKEGVALSFTHDQSTFVVVITAYDLSGRQTSGKLLFILISGNILSLVVIALVGFLFARRAMQPFDLLIRQMNSTAVSDFSFRLLYPDVSDEAGYMARSFNELLAQLQSLAESQKHFVAYASHELRTPLTAVKGMLETSLAYDHQVADTRQSISKALTRLESAIELANALLQLAEVEGLSSVRLLDDINLIDTVLDTVAYFQEKYPEQQIDVQLTDIFTDQSAEIRIVGNASLLRTVLINSIDNAAKYSTNQIINVVVTYQDGWVVIQVTDKGIGIPKEQLKDVFLPMMRACNVGHVHGFGLGLTLAQKIVTMHQGELTIESEVTKGTTVSVRLPALPIK